MDLKFKTGQDLVRGAETILTEPAREEMVFLTSEETDLQSEDARRVAAFLATKTDSYTTEEAEWILREALSACLSAYGKTIDPELAINHLVKYH